MTCTLEVPFDYAAVKKAFPQLAALNASGTCMAMSCKWAQMILSGPQFSARSRVEQIQESVGQLAMAHRTHLSRLENATTDGQRSAAYIKTYGGFGLRCPDLEQDQSIGVSRFPDSGVSHKDWSEGDWMGRQIGDMWGVVGAFLRAANQQGKAFLLHYYTGPGKAASKGGHAVAVYVASTNPSTIRVFDMNDGESLLTGEAGWNKFCEDLDHYNGKASRDSGINFVDLHPVSAS